MATPIDPKELSGLRTQPLTSSIIWDLVVPYIERDQKLFEKLKTGIIWCNLCQAEMLQECFAVFPRKTARRLSTHFNLLPSNIYRERATSPFIRFTHYKYGEIITWCDIISAYYLSLCL